MISRGIRLVFSALILFASIMIGLTGFATPAKAAERAGYADKRNQADRHFMTVRARRYFNHRTPFLFNEAKRKHKVANVKLQLDKRLIHPYGRGSSTANKFLPMELEKILQFISEARRNRNETIRQLINSKSFSSYKRLEIERAVDLLGQVRVIRLGQKKHSTSKTHLAKYDLKRRKLTYFAKWNEQDARYESNSEAETKNIIIYGIIADGQG